MPQCPPTCQVRSGRLTLMLFEESCVFPLSSCIKDSCDQPFEIHLGPAPPLSLPASDPTSWRQHQAPSQQYHRSPTLRLFIILRKMLPSSRSPRSNPAGWTYIPNLGVWSATLQGGWVGVSVGFRVAGLQSCLDRSIYGGSDPLAILTYIYVTMSFRLSMSSVWMDLLATGRSRADCR